MTTIDLCFVLCYNENRTKIEVFRMNEKEIYLEDLSDSIKNIKETLPVLNDAEIDSMVSDFDNEQRKNGKDYDLQRNGKKLIKTEIKYVYKVKDNGGFVYRLLFKDDITGEKVDTWQMFNPYSEKKAPFRTVGEASQHMFCLCFSVLLIA